MTRLLTEFGMGTSLRRHDYTQAAKRALQDALWHNSINLAELYGQPKEAMQITVEIGVQQPDRVDTDALRDIFPYGQFAEVVPQLVLQRSRPQHTPPTLAVTCKSRAYPLYLHRSRELIPRLP